VLANYYFFYFCYLCLSHLPPSNMKLMKKIPIHSAWLVDSSVPILWSHPHLLPLLSNFTYLIYWFGHWKKSLRKVSTERLKPFIPYMIYTKSRIKEENVLLSHWARFFLFDFKSLLTKWTKIQALREMDFSTLLLLY